MAAFDDVVQQDPMASFVSGDGLAAAPDGAASDRSLEAYLGTGGADPAVAAAPFMGMYDGPDGDSSADFDPFLNASGSDGAGGAPSVGDGARQRRTA